MKKRSKREEGEAVRVFPFRRNYLMAGGLVAILLGWASYTVPLIIWSPPDRAWAVPVLLLFALINGASVLSYLRLVPSASAAVELRRRAIRVLRRDGKVRLSIARVAKVRRQDSFWHTFYRGLVVEGSDSAGGTVREGFFWADLGRQAVAAIEEHSRHLGGG